MFAKFKANFSQFFSIFDIECHHQTYVNPIQDGVRGGGAKRHSLPSTIFTPVTSTNVVLIFKNFFSFSFNPFGTRSYLVPVPNY